MSALSGDPAGTTDAPAEPGPPVAQVAASAAEAKASGTTTVLEMTELLGVVDRFVITSGRNVRQVRAIVEDVERAVKDVLGVAPIQVEGIREASWVLLDYGDVVVHVFLDEVRTYYDLEHLWSAAPRTDHVPEVQVELSSEQERRSPRRSGAETPLRTRPG